MHLTFVVDSGDGVSVQHAIKENIRVLRQLRDDTGIQWLITQTHTNAQNTQTRKHTSTTVHHSRTTLWCKVKHDLGVCLSVFIVLEQSTFNVKLSGESVTVGVGAGKLSGQCKGLGTDAIITG